VFWQRKSRQSGLGGVCYGEISHGMAVSVWSGLLGLHGFRYGGLGPVRSGKASRGEAWCSLERRFW